MNDALLQAAARAHQAGDRIQAMRLCTDLLRTNPRHFHALYLMGVLHYETGHFEDAERRLADAVRINPRQPEPFFIRGCALQRLNRLSEALACFEQALAIRPAFAEAAINRGGLLMALQRYDEALASFDAAIKANPAAAEAWNNRGNALSELGRYEEAVASYDKTLSLRPGVPPALINRGTSLLALGRPADALLSYEDALRVDPNNADAMAGRGNALFELKRFDTAADVYEKTLGIDPSRSYALGNLAFSRLHCCDWRSLRDHRDRIAAGVHRGQKLVSPFQILALTHSPEQQRRCAEVWIADKYPPAPAPLWRGENYRHEKIRIAYLSSDFRDHAVATLLAGVFEHHDRKRFETVAISWGPDDRSAMRARLTNAFGRFVDVSRHRDGEVARMLKDMEIDIAVDLMGFTGDCRPKILALRPAPLQINYLGFAGTMGAPYIDAIIADATVIPDAHRIDDSEKTVWLPDTFLPNDAGRAIAHTISARRDAGLPDLGFVFCSFNNSYKITPEIFDIWMRLLRAVPDSILWLSAVNPAAAGNLSREAAARGIADERLIFAPFLSKREDHLARLTLADLFLDTLPYNAHATAVDALGAGIPVLTAAGTTFAGRVAASLLHAVGLPELVTPSLEAYETLALQLANDRTALSLLKSKLARHRDSYPLFDTERYTRNLEAAYIELLESCARS